MKRLTIRTNPLKEKESSQKKSCNISNRNTLLNVKRSDKWNNFLLIIVKIPLKMILINGMNIKIIFRKYLNNITMKFKFKHKLIKKID